MSVVGYSTLEVIPSVVRLRANIERQTASEMAAAGRTAGSKFGDEAGRTGATSFKSRMSGALKGYAPFAGLAIGAGVTTLFKSAVDEASALAESANKIQVTFGDAAGQVNDFADAASEGLGQSDLQARNAAASFGVYGKAAGLAGDDLAGFATELTALSSDLASFYDADSIQQVIDAIGSGLRGEAEPLRQFGVLLDDATLRTKALEQGLIATTKDALTPQQKVLAAHAVIMEQTADAQGDFARTSDGLANSSRDLAADWADMRAELGEKLLPATLEFVGFLKDDALPALETTGGIVKDAAVAFGNLPAPVQAAAGAFVALRIASRFGVGDALAAGASRGASALSSLATRVDLYRIGVDDARYKTVQFADTSARVSTGVGRLSASMQGLRAASLGVGQAVGRGLGSFVGILGGPWGIAITAATAGLTLWWQEHQEAEARVAASKARVEAFTQTLDANTGALTDNTRELAATTIGAEQLRQFEALGFNIEQVIDATLAGGSALERLDAQLRDATGATDAFGISGVGASNQYALLSLKLAGVSDNVAQAQEDQSLFGRAVGESADETKRAAAEIKTYAGRLAESRTELRKLIAAEQERAEQAIQNRRDAIALREQLRAAREEANKGKDVLFDSSKAADANMSALLDLGEQWNNSTAKVRNAEGAFEDFRRKMIDVAQDMTTADGKAKKLVDSLLSVPKDVPLRFRSEGYQQRLAELKVLKAEIALIAQTHTIRFEAHSDQLPRNPAMASGGLLRGPGTGTSDSILLWGSNGEFMQRKAAVDYYGVEFMRRLNALQIPKIPGYAHGGPIQAAPQPVGPSGVNVAHMTVVAQDWRDFLRKGQAKVQAAMSDGVNWG